jgi:hypothetical protein
MHRRCVVVIIVVVVVFGDKESNVTATIREKQDNELRVRGLSGSDVTM